MLWVALGIVIFIFGTIITRHIGGGVLALTAFILWRFGMLGTVIKWIIRIINTAYNYLKALIRVIKDEYFDKSEGALIFVNTKIDLIVSAIII
ncbi:hypothetical protein ACFQWC_19910 [Rossellomorea sp. GCM10028870]|uniref:hypothetical protein n=1 Tax=Rossellomorea sp. GCM10028870 TaxID=3273426 RepID=UPI00361B749A